MPVLGHFISTTLMESTDPLRLQHGACFLLLVEVFDILEIAARSAAARAAFKPAMLAYLGAFVALYGEDVMVEKFHMALHLISQVLDGFTNGCYCLERKHKHVKRFANEAKNTSGPWDVSLMRETTARHIAVLEDPASVHFNTAACLQNPHTPNKRLLRQLHDIFGEDAIINTSFVARINRFEQCSKGDVVMVDTSHGAQVCRVHAHLSVQNASSVQIVSMVHVWSLVELHDSFSEWKMSDNVAFCPTDSIMWACIWTETDGIATVLHPGLLRF